MKKSWFVVFVFLFTFSFALISSEDEGTTEVTITTGTTGIACYSNSTDSYIYNASKSLTDPTRLINITFVNGLSPAQANCSLSVLDTGSFCCPSGSSCNFTTGKCAPGNNVVDCGGFKDEASCIYSPSVTSQKFFYFMNQTLGEQCNTEKRWDSGSINCGNVTTCECYWNSTASRCDALMRQQFDSICIVPNIEDSKCYYGVGNETNNCDNALAKISVTYVPYGNAAGTASCQAQTLDYPCSVSVKLPFFNWFSFVLTAFGIALVYFVLYRPKSS